MNKLVAQSIRKNTITFLIVENHPITNLKNSFDTISYSSICIIFENFINTNVIFYNQLFLFVNIYVTI